MHRALPPPIPHFECEEPARLGNRDVTTLIPLGAAILTGLVSFLVLIGWMGNIDVLKSVIPGWVSMKPNTALGLILCAGALILSLPKTAVPCLLARGMSLLAVGLGGLTLGQYLFTFDVGIDQALFADSFRLLQTSHPGRMAPTSALCFVFLGTALFTFNQPWPTRLRFPVVKAFAAATALIGLFSLIGYAADSLTGARGWVYTGVAVHTALSLLLLGIGLLAAARGEECYTRFLDVPTSAGFLLGILLMLLAAQMAFNHTVQMLQSGASIAHRQEVLKEIRELAAATAALESTQRGYLILGDEGLLEERGPAWLDTEESLREIRRLTADNPQQTARLERLDALLAEKNLWEEQTIEIRRTEGPEVAARLIAKGRGIELREKLLTVIRDMEKAEYTLLASDKAGAETVATTTFLLLPLGVFLSLSVLLCGLFFLNAGMRERDRSEQERQVAYENHAIEMGRINRLYSALSQVNQSIVRTTNHTELFEKICQVLVEQGGFPLVWVGWQDEPARRITVAASWGDHSGYLDDVVIFTDDRAEGRGPTGTAFRENSARICNDIFEDPNTLPWREKAARCGYLATAAFPIHLKGRTVGVLTVYAADRNYFQAEEVALLEEVSGDISFALDTFSLAEENRAAEERIRQEKHFSDAMIESMPGIVYFYDENRRFLRWNRNFALVSGYSDEEIKTLHPLDLFTDRDKPLLEKKIATVFASGEDVVEAMLLSKDGQTTPYYFTGRRMLFEGTPCLVGMGVDVTERHRAEEALRQSEERFRTTLDTMMEGCQLIGFDWKYLYLNDAAVAHGRRPAADLLGRSILEVWPGFESTAVFALLRRTMEDRVARHEETEFVFLDGSKGWFDVRCQPSPEGIFILSIDISERKKAQAELLALNASLERRVAHRTVELEALNRELESFCYSVSHDLRAPLRGIAGFTHLLQETCGAALDATSRGYFDRILAASTRMGELIDDLLKLSRVNREEFCHQAVDLSGLATSVAEDLRQSFPDHAVDLTIAPDLRTTGDVRFLRIVLENLLGNAWKFTSRTSRPRIEFGARHENTTIVFFVQDNGAGFDMRYAGKLFGPFQRLHRLTEFPGTGIGLATVQRIIHRHGGRVWAEATINQGATFYFTIGAT